MYSTTEQIILKNIRNILAKEMPQIESGLFKGQVHYEELLNILAHQQFEINTLRAQLNAVVHRTSHHYPPVESLGTSSGRFTTNKPNFKYIRDIEEDLRPAHIANHECCGAQLTPEVLMSSAGYYIGTHCKNCGPYSRDSEYFRTREEADKSLPHYTYDKEKQ